MKIDIDTLYNTKQKVFVLYEDFKYNDWHRTEVEWDVLSDDTWLNNIIPFSVDKVLLECTENKIVVSYKVRDMIVPEKDLFLDLDKALAECKKRNSKKN